MIFTSPGEIAFRIFNYQVRWYGVFMFLAIICGVFVVLKTAKRFYEEYNEDFLYDLVFILILSGIIGARLYYVLLDFHYFIRYPLEIPAIWQGGLSIHGAIIGAVIGGALFTKKKGYHFFRTADLCTFGLVTGQIIGRWGNFFNSEAFGLPCNLPWKLYIPIESRPLNYLIYDWFHPAFLYESIGSAVILAILFLLKFKYSELRSGTIFLLYLVLYSCLRICIESVRIDSVLSFGHFHIAHIASIITLLIGIAGLIILNKQKSNC